MAKINGIMSNADGMTISEYLSLNGYNKERVAIELNGEILPKPDYSEVVISRDDVIEIVTFVGGG